jgi:SAM-dependent methyltransferase
MLSRLFRRRRSTRKVEQEESPLATMLRLAGGGVDLEKLLADGRPNLGELNLALRNRDAVHLNLKFFGYELARQLAAALPPRTDTVARHVGLSCKASTQADMESDWVAHWCAQLHTPVVFHRKLWELAFLLQALHENDLLRPGARGLGFGCGEEPIPSYLAARGVAVTVTDLAADRAQSTGWAATGQHTTSIDKTFRAELVDRGAFDRLVDLRFVDMNAIPADLAGYDFCWSICAFEHLGSIEQGLRFVENAMATLRPGGIAVHTTEFNIDPRGETIDNWPTVLFQREHFTALAERLTAAGHHVAPLDFDIGDQPMDRFIDLPPWSHDLPAEWQRWHGAGPHLKVGVDGFISTCFGLVIRKGG